jgi:UDP-glucuronate 4-epimerase
MNVLVTGSAGFIGSALSIRLLNRGDTVVGIDNHNNYYDPALKEARLLLNAEYSNYTHFKIDIKDGEAIKEIFNKYDFKKVVNLAAQAGVRYSIDNPIAYIDSNIVGFAHILENCRHYKVEHLVYASSSSVYGANTKMPFSENDSTNHPLSIYAATKKSNELMAHSYSHLYQLPTTGLRFFTAYGPWGRPDMALFKFTKAILEEKPINVYNNGEHTRDFTYIDDITQGILNALDKPPVGNLKWNSNKPDPASSAAPWSIYNIGNNKPVKLMDYIDVLEKAIGKKASLNFLPLQSGDVPNTFADINNLKQDFNYNPKTSVTEGVKKFIEWYDNYYNK